MKKKNLLLFSIFIVLSVLIYYYYAYHQINIKKVNVKLEFVKQYGAPGDSTREGVIGSINGFAIDKHQNIYIADDAFKVVRKFSKDGKQLRTYGCGAGQGPGEFNRLSFVNIDSFGRVYTLDRFVRRVTVFDSENKVLNSIKTPFLPAQLLVVDSTNIDVLGFNIKSDRNDLIYRYKIFSNSQEPELTYCERISGKNSKLVDKCGNSGRLIKGPSGNIYFCPYYPYEIKTYSSDGKYLKTILGEHRLLSAPYRRTEKMVDCPDGIQELTILPNEILMLLFVHGDDGHMIQSFDFFNGINGTYIGSVECADLGLKYVRYMKSDIEGNLYLDYYAPYPHIIQYKMTLEYQK